MRIFISSILISFIALFVAASPVYAATITLTPAAASLKTGQTYTVAVDVDPQGEQLYTVKANISFPVALVEVTNFTIDSAWPLTPPGNFIDNTGGFLTQTAGFMGGFTTTKRFGTLTMRAKANGEATFAVTSNSAAYNSQSNNMMLSGAQGTFVATIATPEAPQPAQEEDTTPTPTQTTPAPEPTEEGSVLGEEAPVVQESTSAPQPLASPRSLLASVGSVVTLGTDSPVVGLLVVVAVLALAGYALYAVIQRTRRKSVGKVQ